LLNVLSHVLWCRWSEDGLWYKAKITDLLPETQSYLVCFVEYGNSQACTLADLAPLDMPVTRAAPAPLVQEETDPVVLEMQRQARIQERQKQLKAEDDARKAVLEEKRRAVAERKAKMDALERAEQLAKIEEQRARLEARPPAAVTALLAAPGTGLRPADVPRPVAAAAVMTVDMPLPAAKPQSVSAPGPSTPVAAPAAARVAAVSTPVAEARTPVNSETAEKMMQKRMTLSAAGGSGAKLGAMKGVTLRELKEIAAKTPLPTAEETPKKHPLDMTITEARAARALDFGSGDTPQKKQLVEEAKTPAKPVAVVVAQPVVVEAKTPAKPVAVVTQQQQQPPPPLVIVSAATLKRAGPPSAAAVANDEEDDEEEEDSDDPMSPRRPQSHPNGASMRRIVPPPTSVSAPLPEAPKQASKRGSMLLPMPQVLHSDESNDSLLAREALESFSAVSARDTETGAAVERSVSTTQILADLEDSLDSELAELEELRREANEVDASINLFQQLKEETNRLEQTASSFAADLGDLEEEARMLLGE
jgi:hypothetical protein